MKRRKRMKGVEKRRKEMDWEGGQKEVCCGLNKRIAKKHRVCV